MSKITSAKISIGRTRVYNQDTLAFTDYVPDGTKEFSFKFDDDTILEFFQISPDSQDIELISIETTANQKTDISLKLPLIKEYLIKNEGIVDPIFYYLGKVTI